MIKANFKFNLVLGHKTKHKTKHILYPKLCLSLSAAADSLNAARPPVEIPMPVTPKWGRRATAADHHRLIGRVSK